MNKTYPIPAHALEITTEVKKSRFIARADCVNSREQAMAMLAKAKQDYPDARHHCWAYLLGNPAATCSAAMNDDGEPGGTAGKPILNVLQHKGIGDVMVIVIRYFGGIKLGAGGLTRAYSGAAEAVMSQLETLQQVAMAKITLQCDFPQEQPLRHWASLHQGELTNLQYGENITITLQLPEQRLSLLGAWCDANTIKYKITED